MGMDTHVIGFRVSDDKHLRMVALAREIQELGMCSPVQLKEYFKGTDYPDCEITDNLGLEVQIENSVAVQKHNADMEDGFEIDIRKLPEGVVKVRVYNSY